MRKYLLLLPVLLVVACQRNNGPIRLQGEAQGTYYNIAYYDGQQRDFRPQIDSLLDDFDQTASLWVENSLIRRVNRHEDSLLNPLFCDLLKKSQEVSSYTGGAFNCEIGALVNLYGFGFKNRSDVSDAEVDSLLACIHHDGQGEGTSVEEVEGVKRLFLPAGVELDFNAIAQGYSVDMLAKMFDQKGVENYLIDVGGEVIARGCKADKSSWTVGIERPAADKYSSQEVEVAIRLDNQSVVTSGNYRKYYEENGVRYSHTIDPRTGRPVNHSLLSVSVVSREAWYADAMATAFMVMGLDKGLQFIKAHPDNPDIQAVFFIYDDQGEYKTYATPAFQKLIIE